MVNISINIYKNILISILTIIVFKVIKGLVQGLYTLRWKICFFYAQKRIGIQYPLKK